MNIPRWNKIYQVLRNMFAVSSVAGAVLKLHGQADNYIQFSDSARLHASCTFTPALERLSGDTIFPAEQISSVTAWLSGLSPE